MLAGAHEGKEHPTSRNDVSTIKYLTREEVLPYKEAQFTPAVHYTVQSLYTIHLVVVTAPSI